MARRKVCYRRQHFPVDSATLGRTWRQVMREPILDERPSKIDFDHWMCYWSLAAFCLAIGSVWLFRKRLRARSPSEPDLKAELQGDKPAVKLDRHGDSKLPVLVIEEKHELPSPGPSVELCGQSLPVEIAGQPRNELPSYREAAECALELEAKSCSGQNVVKDIS